jgi:RNA polymerase sigma factor (TIGR02999 family)
MMTTCVESGRVSRLLAEVQGGCRDAKEQLGRLLIEELNEAARRILFRERPGHTLQAADLVQEVLLRLLEGDVLETAQNRAYLFAAASTAMRRVLVEYARRRTAAKRGGHAKRHPLLDDVLVQYAHRRIDLLALHDALERLQTMHPRQCQVVEEYHFGGFTLREIAEHLGVSEATVCVDLKRGQLWLATQLAGEIP